LREGERWKEEKASWKKGNNGDEFGRGRSRGVAGR